MNENTEKKIGIVTFFKGNYGSALQCYATTVALKRMGYSPYVIDEQTNRISNLFRLGTRCLCHPKHIKTFLNIRKKATLGASQLTTTDKQAMNKFISKQLPILKIKSADLKKIGNDNEFIAFLSGSDQIWGGHEYIVDTTRFLRFAPKSKRIAWVPSFGSSDIACYNKRSYKKYISDYAALSVRETSAVHIVEELVGKTPTALLDPVFLLTRDEWLNLATKTVSEPYVLCYFLDKPNASTLQQITNFCANKNMKIIIFGPCNDAYNNIVAEHLHGDPQAFVSLIAHANCVFTDSFHAVSFSLILNTPFYAYRRNYAHGIDQSSRIKSILEKVNMLQYFEPNNIDEKARDFTVSDSVFEQERSRMKKYLYENIERI